MTPGTGAPAQGLPVALFVMLWLMVCSVVDCMAGAPEQALFDGKDLAGWVPQAGTWKAVGAVELNAGAPRDFKATPGTGVLLNSATAGTTNLVSAAEFGDVELHVEFCLPRGSNSGVYLMGRYEVQIFESWGVQDLQYTDCGGIYARLDKAENRKVEGHAPRVNASKPAGEWQTFDIVFRAPRFDASGKKTENARFIKVVHNGVTIHSDVEVTGPTNAAAFADEKSAGPILLQGDHGPVAFRNLQIKPIDAQSPQ